MHFITGLGNPGLEYSATRHNVGWMFLDYLQEELAFPSFSTQKKLAAELSKTSEVCLIKPQTFMNRSGEAVQKVMHYYDQASLQDTQLEQLLVVHDDLDLEVGQYKIQFGRGPKVHNGINSIRQSLGTDQFWYIRVGVDGRQGDRTLPGHVYVLQQFTTLEKELVTATFAQICQRLVQDFGLH